MEAKDLCELMFNSLRNELFPKVKDLPKYYEQYSVEENAGALVLLYEDFSNNPSQSEQESLFSALVLTLCGDVELDEHEFAERWVSGLNIVIALTELKRAESDISQENYGAAALGLISCSYWNGSCDGVEIGLEAARSAAKTVLSDKMSVKAGARYIRDRIIMDQAFQLAKQLWEEGAFTGRHPEMKTHLEKYQDDDKQYPFVKIPDKTLNRAIKKAAIAIGRPDLIRGHKK